MEPSTRNTPGGNRLLPVFGLLAFLGIIAIGVIPAAREIEHTRTAIARLQADLRQQEALLPVYQSLQEQRERTLPEGIHVHARKPLEIDDLAALPNVFEELARSAGLELVSATPQVRSLRDGRETLRLDTRMRGDFQAFNTLLNLLNKMPFVETIETLGVEVIESAHEMHLSVWLAIR